MALSNRDRVGRAFEQLATGLRPYVDERMRLTATTTSDWLTAFTRSARPPIHGDASLNDPALLLRVMAESWEVAFRPVLLRADRNLVFELRDVRNKWAHNDAFTIDDAYRALDSIERLLVSVAAGSEAATVGQSKDDLMRARLDQRAKEAAATPVALLTEAPAGMRPWREVIQPHDDVARGRFELAEFAADLSMVASDVGAAEYRLPVPFFQRTFLTEGLRSLLTEAVQRVTGAGGAPVVDLQTTFGGGKTHSMIALYHLFSGTPISDLPLDVRELLGDLGVDALPEVRRVVLVGTDLTPGQPMEHDGVSINTMWGELAWRLGGAEAYALLAEADRSRTNPGGALRTLLAAYSPCVVLIDEWVAYARGLYADDHLAGGTFDSHFSFAQALTEAARATPGALVVVSLPAPGTTGTTDDDAPIGSEAELGGAGGRETLRRLRAVVGRMDSSWRPATAEESFEIVRRRLFQDLDEEEEASRDATAKKFAQMYRKQADEFPAECREAEYEARIAKAYPIHPELFARLYEDWSTLERFQRTRGVLRLMANVVQALWAAGDQSPLILPSMVPLSDATVATELTRNLEDAWKPIIDLDVDGEHSVPRALDSEIKNLGRYGAARRVTRTVFLGSAPLVGSPNQGIDAARVRLGCAVPGDAVAIYADALNRMADKGTYFFAGNGRYWYGTQPGLARRARDRADRLLALPRHEVRDKIAALLKPSEPGVGTGDFAAVHHVPASPADVSDVASARLVILGPDSPHRPRSDSSDALAEAKAILESRGSALRDYRNMLVFLAADQRGVDDLEQAVAEQLAWASIVAEADDIGLNGHQTSQAAERRDTAADTVALRLAGTYQWLLVPQQSDVAQPVTWESLKVDGPGPLAARASEKLRFGGELYLDYPRELLRLKLDGPLASLFEDGSATVATLWEAYARYLYLHRVKDVAAFCSSLAVAPANTTWEMEGVGLAEAQADDGRYLGLIGGEAAVAVRGDMLVVRPEVAARQLAEDRASDPLQPDDEDPAFAAEVPAADDRRRRFHGSVKLDAARLAVDAARINTEVLSHLHGLEGAEMELTLEIRAVRPDGFPADVVRVVDENAAALRFDDHGFEAQ